MFKAKSFLVALVYMTMGYFHHHLCPFLHFWLIWCPRDNIYKATFVRTHVSTPLIAQNQSTCHSPPLCEYLILLSYIGWLFFYLKKMRSALPLWAGMQMPHSSDRPPPTSIAIWTKVKVSPQRPRPHMQQNPFKAVTQHAFFSLPRLMASLYACFCFSVVNGIHLLSFMISLLC